MDKDKLERGIHDFGKRELRVLEETMVQPMREKLKDRGLSERDIDRVFNSELNKRR